MADSLRWGILSTGNIAGSFADDLLVDGATIAAVGSRSLESARAFAEPRGIPHAHGDYPSLVADPDVDAVYVASPHPFHAEHALLALEAGKHVLVEKPFTMSAAEARTVAETAQRQGLVALEAMWTRYLPHMVRLRELIASGVIGEVHSVVAQHAQSLPSDPTHRLQNPELGGGALLDLGVYPVAFAHDVLGVPDEVLAHSVPTATGVDARTAITLGWNDGRQAMLQCALDLTAPNRASVYGTEGWIDIDGFFLGVAPLLVYRTGGELVERFAPTIEGRGMYLQARALEKLVREGAAPALDTSGSIEIMSILDRVRERIGLRYPGE